MEVIICDYHLTEKDIIDFQLRSMYKRPMIIFLTVIAFMMIITVAMHFLRKDRLYDSIPFFQIIFPIFVLIALPLISYFQSKKTFRISTHLHSPIRMSLSSEFLLLQGKGFESKLEWANILRVREDKTFFKIYTQKNIAQLLPKHNLTENSIDEIRKLLSNIRSLDYT